MKREAYPAVDIAKFVLAILVVAIHVQPFRGMTGFLYDNCVARIADPLFFAITAFSCSEEPLNRICPGAPSGNICCGSGCCMAAGF